MDLTLVPGGPLSESISRKVREKYIENAEEVASFLPPERLLLEEFGAARSTVRRALNLLAVEGLIRAERGRGYRIIVAGASETHVKRMAVLQDFTDSSTDKWIISDQLESDLHRAAIKRKWEVLFVNIANHSEGSLLKSLRDADVEGVAMAFDNVEIHKMLSKSGLPCVVLDSPSRELPTDYIMQDNYSGARRAARYLLKRGHKRIAWIGPKENTAHSYERFAGAHIAFIENELDISQDLILHADKTDEKSVKSFLSRKELPTAILALWHDHSIMIDKVISDMGMKVGTDIELVSWATEVQYSSTPAEVFASKNIPPTVVWSTYDMADIAVARLHFHKMEPGLKPLHIAVPTRLAGGKNGMATLTKSARG